MRRLLLPEVVTTMLETPSVARLAALSPVKLLHFVLGFCFYILIFICFWKSIYVFIGSFNWFRFIITFPFLLAFLIAILMKAICLVSDVGFVTGKSLVVRITADSAAFS